ncbi:MAG: MATE family efflux transporter [Actinomycetales bacterium]
MSAGARPLTRHREVLALAVPAFATLVSEPLFLLADSAIVGHLGPTSLAALGIASAVLSGVVGLSIFLAYGTTAATARRLGAGDRRGALAMGVDGLWLAIGLGTVLAVGMAVAAEPVVRALGGSDAVTPDAVAYLRASLIGLPGMLVVLAATGVLRGLLDTRTPLVVAVIGAGSNAALNWLLVYPAGLGIAGSGLGTAIVQLGMGLVLGLSVVRHARRAQASLRPRPAGILLAARTGVPLVVRSAAMRVALLLTASTAAAMGDTQLAAHQVVFTVWTFTTFALDALAIAAQALTGRYLGAGNVDEVRDATGLMVRWGVGFGCLLTVVLLAIRPWLGNVFTPDEAVRAAIAAALVPCALAMPLSGYVFVIDGVLIGAGDGRYLGGTAVLNTAVYLVGAGLLLWRHQAGDAWADGQSGLVALWVVFVVFWMGSRAVTLRHRERGTTWLVTGAT